MVHLHSDAATDVTNACNMHVKLSRRLTGREVAHVNTEKYNVHYCPPALQTKDMLRDQSRDISYTLPWRS